MIELMNIVSGQASLADVREGAGSPDTEQDGMEEVRIRIQHVRPKS